MRKLSLFVQAVASGRVVRDAMSTIDGEVQVAVSHLGAIIDQSRACLRRGILGYLRKSKETILLLSNAQPQTIAIDRAPGVAVVDATGSESFPTS